MSEAPERIDVLIRDGRVHLPNGSAWKPHDFTPYILATPTALAASAEVQALIEDAKADFLDGLAAGVEADGSFGMLADQLRHVAAMIRAMQPARK